MSDGRIWFNTKIDNSHIEKDLKVLENKIRKAEESISKSENAKLPLLKQAEDLNAELSEAKQHLESLKADMAGAQAAMAPGASAEDYIRASSDLPGLQEAVKSQEANVATLQKQWDSVNGKISTYDAKIQQANTDIERNKAKAAELVSQMGASGGKMQAAFDRSRAAAGKFGKRLLEIAKSVLIFNVVSSAIRAVVSHMGKMLKTNSEYSAQLAKLKGALLTAFQPIYEFVLPGVIAVLKVLTAIVQVVANVLSALGGKTSAQSAKNAKALNDEAKAIDSVGGAAKDAEKSLAGFDEINALSSPDAGGGGGGGGTSGMTADFTEFDTAAYQAKIDELTAYLSGALLALGAILAFSGANIPLGIGLMAAGAIGLVSVIKENWDSMSGSLSGALTKVLVVLGGAALVIGAILAFSGVDIIKGIALMAIGAASLAGAATLNWNSIVTALQGPIGEITAIVSSILLVLGLVLAFSGIATPLGLALIAAGAVGLVTVGAMNWNAIKEKLSTVWAGIKQWFDTNVKPKLTLTYWKEKFSNIADGLVQKIKDGVNAGIGLFNRFIDWLNEKLKLSWGDFSIGGVKIIDKGSFQLLKLPKIPLLAQGAVLPANKPFLAMVGDQKNGTNVEAPLETIKQALAEVMAAYGGGGGDIVIRFEGDLAQLGRALKPVIDTENKRVGPSLAGGNVR